MTFRRLLKAALFAGYIAGLPLALAQPVDASPVSLRQSLGLSQPAQRVVSLAPHMTENLFAIGAGAQVVGVSSYSDFPEQAQGLPKVGDANQVNLEAIIALRPDVVVAWDFGGAMTYAQRLAEFGIPVWTDTPETLSSIGDSLRALGQITGHEALANQQADALARSLAGLSEEYRTKAPVKVFFEIWSKPLMTANHQQIVSQLIDLCGGENVFADLKDVAPQISQEAVINAAPDVILMEDTQLVSSTARWQPWKVIPAVQNGHIYGLNADVIHRPTPRILEGAEAMCRQLDRVRQN